MATLSKMDERRERTANDKDIALEVAYATLRELSEHPAFANHSAPEFNSGGVGYEALIRIENAMRNISY